MDFKKFSIDMTGIKDGLAARKLMLLFILAWLISFGCAYYSILYVDRMGQATAEALTQHVTTGNSYNITSVLL